MPAPAVDPLALAQALIRCPSVTPADAGALDVLASALKELGFACERLPFGGGEQRVDNLYARIGSGAPHFCFAGHTDVVPPGDRAAWHVDPFAGTVRDAKLFGRGAADMKGAIASFVTGASAFLREAGARFKGSVSLIITGDEEGAAVNGTCRVLEWLASKRVTLDHCLVGEPTNPDALGDMIKIGRRGSLSALLTVKGEQGHVAYPQDADNPIPRLLALLARLTAKPLDGGTAHFEPSRLEITSIDVGNPVTNVIPAEAHARFNIRFNDKHTSASLRSMIEAAARELAGVHELEFQASGEAFLTPPGPFSALIVDAVHAETGRTPKLSTAGGTSDARFIRSYCPVVEFGLAGRTMHKVDEHVPVGDLHTLARIYARVLARYFAAPLPAA
jgi:succinyl-diaminopimelate desuccinylase